MKQVKRKAFDDLLSQDVRPFLRSRFGLVYARVEGHHFWPARICGIDEWVGMVDHRQKEGQICVYFFGAQNYGWVSKLSLLPFALTPPPTIKRKNVKKKGLSGSKRIAEYRAGMEESCKLFSLQEENEGVHASLLDSILEDYEQFKQELLRCDECQEIDDRELVACSGIDCEGRLHKGCIPGGSKSHWMCHLCMEEGEQLALTPSKKNNDEAKSSPDKKTMSGKKLGSGKKVKSKSTGERKSIDKKARDKKGTDGKTADGKKFSEKEKPAPLVVDDGDISDEKCLVCHYGGELVMCDFSMCNKVYHRLCLGAYPFAESDSTKWVCPQHTCAETGVQDEEPPEKKGSASPARLSSGSLWKCEQCPVAVSSKAMGAVLYKQLRTVRSVKNDAKFVARRRMFVCGNCSSPTPMVELAQILERIWSTIATSPQGLPFVRPLFPGIARTSIAKKKKTELDLMEVLKKIRRLEYATLELFMKDMTAIVRSAMDIAAKQNHQIGEVIQSVLIVVNEQVSMYNKATLKVMKKIEAQTSIDKGTSTISNWVTPWRKECMPFGDKTYITIDSRTVDEWADYLLHAPSFVRYNVKKHEATEGGPTDLSSPTTNGMGGFKDSFSSKSSKNQNGTSSKNVEAITKYEKFDIAEAMMGLQGLAHDANASAIDFFLSPSNRELEHMFTRQEALLRLALRSQATLRRAWTTSQERLLGEAEDSITIGEGRLAMELRVANESLRKRLSNKDTLIDQLTKDQLSLTKKLEMAEKQLKQALANEHEPIAEDSDSEKLPHMAATRPIRIKKKRKRFSN